MTKENRYNFIANLCSKVRGSKTQVVTALPSEVREETRLAAIHNDDQDIVDEGVETRVISPALAAIVKTSTHAKHASIDECLTPTEHPQLARELADYRKTHVRPPSYSKRWALAVIFDPFANMKRAEVVSCQTVNA